MHNTTRLSVKLKLIRSSIDLNESDVKAFFGPIYLSIYPYDLSRD